MDKLESYRTHVQDILRNYQRLFSSPPDPGVETQVIFDREHDHYQLLHVGWRQGVDPVFACPLHIDIKEGKIWIQRDLIDVEGGIAGELLERGVPKEDIVLAFHAPYKRPYTGFATGQTSNSSNRELASSENEHATLSN
jgi:hypothetical protein